MAPAPEDSWSAWVVREVREHQLRSVGTLWAAGVSGSLLYNWSRPLPTSLKIIHSRMYAQALTIGALLAAAGVEMYGAAHGMGKEPVDHTNEYHPHAPQPARGAAARHA